jgi:hypothetical protein
LKFNKSITVRGTAVKLGAIYAGYQLSKPLIDAAIANVLMVVDRNQP